VLLRPEQRRQVLIAVRDAVPDRVIIAGAGGISTEDCVEQVRLAREVGVDGVLVVTPPYVKPTPRGLLAHYATVAGEGVPVVAYVVPGRTGVAVSAADQARILEIDGVVGIKEASGNLTLLSQVAEEAERLGKVCLVGDDATTLPGLAVGAHGLVSVAGQIIPRALSGLIRAFREGRIDQARALHRRFLPLMEAMFLESNPLPVKQCLVLQQQVEPYWRLPLVPPNESTTERLRTMLQDLNLLEAPFRGDVATVLVE
jgi:4-hydroxy-tetrahydrodipicolinate synthase